jgi:hypothetical protein
MKKLLAKLLAVARGGHTGINKGNPFKLSSCLSYGRVRETRRQIIRRTVVKEISSGAARYRTTKIGYF